MIDGLANLDPLVIAGMILAGLVALALWPGLAIAAHAARREPLPTGKVATLLGLLFVLWLFSGICLALHGGRAQEGVGLSLLLSAVSFLGAPLLALAGYAVLRRLRAPGWCIAGVGSGLLLVALAASAALVWNAGGWPLLAYAARHQRVGMVRALLRLGMSPNRPDRFHYRPLEYVVARGNGELASLLLANGAEADANNGAALVGAVWLGQPQLVSLLLARGVDVGRLDANGRTPLMQALARCDMPVVELLLASGALRSYHGENRLAAVRAACERGEQALVTRLLHQEELRNRLSGTALATELVGAAGDGDREAVENLLEAGADVNAVQLHRTALIAAGEEDHTEVIDLLVSRGVDLDGRDEDGRTALMHAAMMGRERALRVLSKHGATVDAVDPFGRTALMEACQMGRADIVRVLLELGASTSLRDQHLADALTLACRAERAEIVQLLGGSCEKATRDGRQTGNFGPPEIRREMVRQRATGVEQELFQAVSDGNAERVSAMLASAWPVNRKSEVVVGGTVLLWAAYCDRPQIVSLLIAHGADLNLPSDQGSTPLIEAAKMGHAEVVGVLLAAGADANRQTGKGWTALMWSVEGGHAAVVRMLLNAGAGIEVRNNRGETALDIATRLRRDELRAILQSRSTQ